MRYLNPPEVDKSARRTRHTEDGQAADKSARRTADKYGKSGFSY